MSRGHFYYPPAVLKPLICAVAFLTRLPVPHVEAADRDLTRSAAFFPWVGMVVAGLCGVCALALAPLGPQLAAGCCVALWAWLTGGLHLDGLADAADGLSGGRGEAERTLQIMRDSRIGAHGAVALILALGLKWAALQQVLSLEPGLDWLAVPVVARLVATLLIAAFPYARDAGLGSAFEQVGMLEILLAALSLVPLVHFLGPHWWLPAGVGALTALALALRFRHLLGGLTGDVYGACIECCEVAALIALAWPRG